MGTVTQGGEGRGEEPRALMADGLLPKVVHCASVLLATARASEIDGLDLQCMGSPHIAESYMVVWIRLGPKFSGVL